jgi:hypothetical protein
MNALKKNLTGKTVRIDPKYLKGSIYENLAPVFLCKEGLGCLPKTVGREITATHVDTDRTIRIEGYMVVAIVKEEEDF